MSNQYVGSSPISLFDEMSKLEEFSELSKREAFSHEIEKGNVIVTDDDGEPD